MEFNGTVLILRKFASKEECKDLASWAEQSKEQFVDGISRNQSGEVERVKFRITNRISDNINYPDIIYKLRSRIADTLKLESNPPIERHGKDGIVCSITYDGGDVYEHIDPPTGKGLEGLRCNLLAQEPTQGGRIIINGRGYDLKVGDLHCYLVTRYRHQVETCYGRPRILFMFGWAV